MSNIIVNRIGNSLTGSYGNKTFGVSFSPERYAAMIKLEEKSNEASSMKELMGILEEFELLTKEDFKELIESECPDIYVNRATGKFYLKISNTKEGLGKETISSISMPDILVDKIKDSLDKGIDHTPLVKFWIRWLRNPVLRKKSKKMQEDFSERVFTYINAIYINGDIVAKLMEEEGLSKEIAEERASVYQVKITKEGLLCTYKVSREIDFKYGLDSDGEVVTMDRYTKSVDPDTGIITYDEPEFVEQRVFEPVVMGQGGDPFFCEELGATNKEPGHVIRVGATHRLPNWEYVDTNNNRSCVKGLHVGGLSYISGYQHENTVTHNVFVDPMHVGAVPAASHENDGAIRCLQYFVHSSFAGLNGSIYHSSQYAELTDIEWLTMKKEIMENFGEYSASIEQEINEISEL